MLFRSMAGGTYARYMENAVAFGTESPHPNDPAWVGKAHMKNEAMSLENAKQACEIFIKALIRLQEIDF